MGLLLEYGANPAIHGGIDWSASNLAPLVIQELREEQHHRMQEYLSLSAFLQGLIPNAVSDPASFLLSDWEASQAKHWEIRYAPRHKAVRDDLKRIGAGYARKLRSRKRHRDCPEETPPAKRRKVQNPLFGSSTAPQWVRTTPSWP